jgi:hypothetical protein
MRRRLLTSSLAATLALGALTGLSACGGSSSSSDLSSKPADTIVAAAVNAAEGAHSVHMAGSLVQNGQELKLDLHLVANKGARGRISVGGLSFQFIQLTGLLYIRADPAFLAHFGNFGATRLAGRWLRASPSSSGFGGFTGLTDLHRLFDTLLRNHGKLSKAGTTIFHGRSVVALKDTTRGGTLYIASSGTPYPLGVDNSSRGGQLQLDRYNESVPLTAPSGAVDLSRLD